MPLRAAAKLSWDRSFTRIQRTNMQRTVNVTADVDPAVANANVVMSKLASEPLAELERNDPELSWAPGGEQKSEQESTEALSSGFSLALVAMFGLLAVAFRSYVQPLIVLLAIPYGALGALVGHLLLGFDLSLSSMFGLVALSGVVVNDSLLLVVAINDERGTQTSLVDAAVTGGARRFRPVLMTSLTTFFGLSPMIFETSVQARFLIPMALALGFGILLATPMLVLVVPSFYLVIEDVKKGLRAVGRKAGLARQPGSWTDAQ